jgi:hypothetical protein
VSYSTAFRIELGVEYEAAEMTSPELNRTGCALAGCHLARQRAEQFAGTWEARKISSEICVLQPGQEERDAEGLVTLSIRFEERETAEWIAARGLFCIAIQCSE